MRRTLTMILLALVLCGCVRRPAPRWACPCTPSRGEIPLPGRDDDWRQRR